MSARSRRIFIVALISSVIVLADLTVALPVPDNSTVSTTSETPLLSVDTAEKRADEVVSQPDAEPIPAPSPSAPARVLPPVDTVLENEIWQYRYPPFDNLFTTTASDDEADGVDGQGRTKEQFDSLPSYVLGILDPAELVDGLFQRRPFVPFRSGEFLTNRKNTDSDVSDVELNDSNDNAQSNNGFKRNSKSFLGRLQSPRNVLSVPKLILESDDRWVWGTAF